MDGKRERERERERGGGKDRNAGRENTNKIELRNKLILDLLKFPLHCTALKTKFYVNTFYI